MSTSSTTAVREPPAKVGLRAAASDWARTDGLTWIHLFKALMAAFLALGIAMKLDLPQPRTALMTVFIVMQPQSGAVLAKSFYRICGTLVGLIATLTFVALFSQESVLFMGAIAIWTGICTAGATRNRNFRTYGFLLAGYTTALIGIPAAQHPDGAFISAMTRTAEVSLGVLCAGVVSALVFPQHATEKMRDTVRARYAEFVEYVSEALAGRVERVRIEMTNTRFLSEIVGFESMRSIAVFEGHESRMRAGRLARLNSEFMAASTRFHALHQLMNRLREAGAMDAVDAIEPYFKELAPLLHQPGAPVLSAGDAARAAVELAEFKRALPRRVRETRTRLAATPGFPLLEFDTAAELLYRFVEEMLAYAQTYASLPADTHEREQWVERYEPKTNAIATAIAGVRGGIVMLVLSWFWIETAWPSGSSFVLMAAATCALASSSPRPARMSYQMGIGTALAALCGLVVEFGIYPHIDGFPLLCAALAPFLAFGVLLSTRPQLAGYGAGFLIFFCFLAGPDNVIRYDPSAFLNDAIALVLSMAICALAYAVLLPPSTPWLRNHLLADLRRQVVLACRGALARVRSRFESSTRDLAFQAHALAEDEPDVRRDALRWLVAVLEVGNAVIDLRRELAELPRDARYAETMPWRRRIVQVRQALVALFDAPRAQRLDAALAATGDAIAAVQQVLETFTPPRDERHRLQRILSHLHFVRAALLDPQSPLAAFAGRAAGNAGPAPTSGDPHAS